MAFKLLVATPLSEDGLAALRAAPDLHLTLVQPDRAALLPHLAEAHALIIGAEIAVDAALLDAAPCLRLIGRALADLNDIDLDEATRRGIIVMNSPGVDAVTVAEYSFGLLLALVRNIVPAHNRLAQGDPSREALTGWQLQGKRLGIIGFGRVGREVAARANAFGMTVLASDPYLSESRLAGLRVQLVGLAQLLAEADIITLHCSVLPETEQLINADTLAAMKPGLFLINVKDSRLLDAAALRAALDSGQVAGAALDHLGSDPADSLLRGHPRVLHSLRMRDNTYEAQRDQSALIAAQVIDALREQDYRNAVNLPFMPGQEYEKIQPMLQLAERIGTLLHHLGHQAAIQRVSLELSGEDMPHLKPLTVALLKGLLAPALGQHVNYINAPVLAVERGIHVTQGTAISMHSYAKLFSCQVIWEDGFELVVAGVLFNEREPRIVQLDRYRTDFAPAGVLLVMGSYDVPGVIGRVGSFMAEHSINIAGWRTSRVEKGGHTLSIVSIDEALDKALLDELRSLDFVRHLTQIIF